ncbi:hypothetical protein F5148DRAFT_1151450 [Russula earlei]|uniref:Uncharacterized protein n=1 Tax=Russula earlei TaxID=71964 RepID=A0ACC0U114_9AGAM|nr:hypothetical protein F5148DRAFT_1151450 [Russula earlei]
MGMTIRLGISARPVGSSVVATSKLQRSEVSPQTTNRHNRGDARPPINVRARPNTTHLPLSIRTGRVGRARADVTSGGAVRHARASVLLEERTALGFPRPGVARLDESEATTEHEDDPHPTRSTAKPETTTLGGSPRTIPCEPKYPARGRSRAGRARSGSRSAADDDDAELASERVIAPPKDGVWADHMGVCIAYAERAFFSFFFSKSWSTGVAPATRIGLFAVRAGPSLLGYRRKLLGGRVELAGYAQGAAGTAQRSLHGAIDSGFYQDLLQLRTLWPQRDPDCLALTTSSIHGDLYEITAWAYSSS